MEVRHMLSALWRTRTGPVLIAVQIAIALAALVNITWLISQRLEAYTRPTGLDIDNIFWLRSISFASDYDQKSAVETDLQWLNSLPGVIAASASNNPPQIWWGIGMPFSATPQDATTAKEGARVYMMSARAVETLGVKLAAGRTFSPESVVPPLSDFGAAI